ncbi:MAG: hypothetical protein IK077_02765, partial [Thermoguttaceae bacterium]|nr:hypothetical protein [Thermoguttaceae bacterium]
VFSDHGEVEAFNSISSFADWSEAENNLVYDGSQNLFVDPERGDYALREGSAAINAGKNERAQGDVDLSGAKRIVDGTVDIGAYEYQGSSAK